LWRSKEVAMKRVLTAVAALAVLTGTAAFATSASANSFAGFVVGYSNRGGFVSAYAPPPVYYAPPPAVYRPYPFGYYAPPVIYGPSPYYRRWPHRYDRPYRHW
jgi:hypothetical protein